MREEHIQGDLQIKPPSGSAFGCETPLLGTPMRPGQAREPAFESAARSGASSRPVGGVAPWDAPRTDALEVTLLQPGKRLLSVPRGVEDAGVVREVHASVERATLQQSRKLRTVHAERRRRARDDVRVDQRQTELLVAQALPRG
eukprot:6113050-Prymnesium_polylepis.1